MAPVYALGLSFTIVLGVGLWLGGAVAKPDTMNGAPAQATTNPDTPTSGTGEADTIVRVVKATSTSGQVQVAPTATPTPEAIRADVVAIAPDDSTIASAPLNDSGEADLKPLPASSRICLQQLPAHLRIIKPDPLPSSPPDKTCVQTPSTNPVEIEVGPDKEGGP
jgi:hypothetical protein